MSYTFNRSQSTGNCRARRSSSSASFEPFDIDVLGSQPQGINVRESPSYGVNVGHGQSVPSFSYGGNLGQTVSASGFRTNLARRQSVRDCMLWENSISKSGSGSRLGGRGGGGGGCWNQGSGYGSMNNAITPMGYPQAKAFVKLNGRGQGEGGSRSQIPCKLAPIGTNPQSMLQAMDPVTLRVSAPSPILNANGGQDPYTFNFDTNQIYGQMHQ